MVMFWHLFGFFSDLSIEVYNYGNCYSIIVFEIFNYFFRGQGLAIKKVIFDFSLKLAVTSETFS